MCLEFIGDLMIQPEKGGLSSNVCEMRFGHVGTLFCVVLFLKIITIREIIVYRSKKAP